MGRPDRLPGPSVFAGTESTGTTPSTLTVASCPGPRQPVLGGEMSARVEEGYLEFQSRYARVGFGSMYRNWGLPSLPGFLRSDYAYSQEEVSYRVGTDRIYLIGMFASYGDYGSRHGTHYVAIHRLEIRPIDDLLISVSESSVHGGAGSAAERGSS